MRSHLLMLLLLCGMMLTLSAQDDSEEPALFSDRYFFTSHRMDGNRLIDGQGTFPDVITVDIPLRGRPAWAVGYAMQTAIWHVVMDNGDLQVVDVTMEGSGNSLAFEASWFAPAQPPLIGVSQLDGTYVVRSDDTVSPLSHPIPVNDVDLLYVSASGDLVLARETGAVSTLPLNAQLDARLVMNEKGQVALYANATNQRYVHAIMGDDLEGSTLLIVEVVEDALRVVARVDLPGEDVFEGLSPMWADVNDDGQADLITTVSNSSRGAQIRAYLFDGTKFTSEVDGPAIGQGFRWRHQLAWGAFGPNGEHELVDVLTPHIGGVVEFYQFDGNSLNIVAQLRGATSHLIGSRNLDMAVAGDFNGDGQLEIAVLNQARDTVIGVQHTPEGAREIWRLSADGEIVTNLSAVELLGGTLGLAVGTADGRLRVWLSQ